MPEQILNIEQLLQDYVRDRDAMVERSARRHAADPAKLLAAIRETSRANDLDKPIVAIRETSRANTLLANRFTTTAPSHWIPNVELFINREQCLVINVELAGMRREDLEITIDANRLMISGQRPEREQSGSESSLLLRDIHYGPFQCVIEIPAGYELSRAKAAYQNGFLRVEVPKTQPVSLPLPTALDIQGVLHDYVQDRDRVAANVVLKPELLPPIRPESATEIIANVLSKPAPRRWWRAVRRFLTVFGRGPKEMPAPINFPSEKEIKAPESREVQSIHLGRPGVAEDKIASAEADYERQWARAILDRALTRLAQEHAAAGRTERFETLKEFLFNQADLAPVAAKLRIRPGAVAVLVSRLRNRFRSLVREEIARTGPTSKKD